MTKFPARLPTVSVEKSRSRRSSAVRVAENGHTRKFTTETVTPSRRPSSAKIDAIRAGSMNKTGHERKQECQRESGPDVQP